MAFSITELLTAVNQGLARPNAYRARILFPRLTLFGANQLEVLCESAELPGRQLNTAPEFMYGVERKMPFHYIYENFSLTFICTATMRERWFFDKWQSFICNPTSNYMHYYDEYKSNIVVETLTSTGKIGYVTYIEEAYPVAVLPQQLSYGDDGYLRLTVDFSYKRWRNQDEVDAGNKMNKGHNIQQHVTPTTGPSFEGEWRAPDQLNSQNDSAANWSNLSRDPWNIFGLGNPEVNQTTPGQNTVSTPEIVVTGDVVNPNESISPPGSVLDDREKL